MFGLIEVLRAMRPNAYLELVHRLDRQTSGCLLVAKSRTALNDLRAALRADTCEKQYLALVDGIWRGGTQQVDAPLARDQERGGERIVAVDRAHGRRALSEFTPLEIFADSTLMQVRISTGRTHQIRVHAAHCGHPVAADNKYAANTRCANWRRTGLERMFLHATDIKMSTREQDLHLHAPLTQDLSALLTTLRTGTREHSP